MGSGLWRRGMASLVVVVTCLLGLSAPAEARGAVGAYTLPTTGVCTYSGNNLVAVSVGVPRVGMAPRWARHYRAQIVGVRTTLLGYNGRWVPLKTKPTRKKIRHRRAGLVRVGVRGLKAIPKKRQRTLLRFAGSELRPGYSAYRIQLTLTWYKPTNARAGGRVRRLMTTYDQKGQFTSSCARQAVPPPNVRQIVSGDAQLCALMTDATVRCWGAGSYNRLGNGSTANRTRPTTVPGLTGVTSLAVGNAHGCAVAARVAKCWGYDAHGEVGNGAAATTQTGIVNVKSLAGPGAVFGGYDTTCATSSGQPLKCWGLGDTGQLGNKAKSNSSTPVAVAGVTSVTSAGSGRYHTCAMRASDGSVWCWGLNNYGQIGKTTMDSTTLYGPSGVPGLLGASKIAVGTYHTCAIVANGAVRCWGFNGNGQLGNGTNTNAATPVAAVGLSNVTDLSAWGRSTCAVTGGRVYCWGINDNGQLGIGNTTAYNRPVLVPGLTGIVGVTMGGRQACAWRADGRVWCWGNNSYGQLATGTTTSTRTPVEVSIH